MSKQLDKLEKEFTKSCKKFIKSTTLEQYLSAFNEIQPVTYYEDDRNLFITSSYFANLSTRRTMVRTIKGLDYKRGNKEWCEFNVIPFIQEVFTLSIEGSANYEEDRKEISQRYNVPVSRLNTQVALFIRNYENGNDKYGIGDYYSKFDIFAWKYRDLSKLQEDLEKGKVSKETLEIVHSYYTI